MPAQTNELFSGSLGDSCWNAQPGADAGWGIFGIATTRISRCTHGGTNGDERWPGGRIRRDKEVNRSLDEKAFATSGGKSPPGPYFQERHSAGWQQGLPPTEILATGDGQQTSAPGMASLGMKSAASAVGALFGGPGRATPMAATGARV
mgnify:CR=1 FL=1